MSQSQITGLLQAKTYRSSTQTCELLMSRGKFPLRPSKEEGTARQGTNRLLLRTASLRVKYPHRRVDSQREGPESTVHYETAPEEDTAITCKGATIPQGEREERKERERDRESRINQAEEFTRFQEHAPMSGTGAQLCWSTKMLAQP